jgi:hypothetical protein
MAGKLAGHQISGLDGFFWRRFVFTSFPGQISIFKRFPRMMVVLWMVDGCVF